MLFVSDLFRSGFASHQFDDGAPGSLFDLFAKRKNTARRLVFRDPLDPPERKKQVTQPEEWFVMGHGVRPIVKRIQVKTAQEYPSRVDLVEDAPALFARGVEHDHNWLSGADSRALVCNSHWLLVPC